MTLVSCTSVFDFSLKQNVTVTATFSFDAKLINVR